MKYVMAALILFWIYIAFFLTIFISADSGRWWHFVVILLWHLANYILRHQSNFKFISRLSQIFQPIIYCGKATAAASSSDSRERPNHKKPSYLNSLGNKGIYVSLNLFTTPAATLSSRNFAIILSIASTCQGRQGWGRYDCWQRSRGGGKIGKAAIIATVQTAR